LLHGKICRIGSLQDLANVGTSSPKQVVDVCTVTHETPGEHERVAHESGTAIETYTDYAISGDSLKNRPRIRALLNDAKSFRFDYVIAEALDRISSDQEDIAAIYKRLRHADVRLITLAEGEINELHVGLKGTMNALFLKDLALKTRRGQRGRVEAGKIPGGNSFSYRIVRRVLDDGSIATGEREIDPEQAAIVRRIFKEYTEGMTPRRIASRLNCEGVASPRGGQWNASTINGNQQRRNGVLNNELYVGRINYNRQRFVKDPETAKRRARPNPEHQWATREVSHLRIVDDDLWHRVLAIKQRYSSRWGNKRQSKKTTAQWSSEVRTLRCRYDDQQGRSLLLLGPSREGYMQCRPRDRGTPRAPAFLHSLEPEMMWYQCATAGNI
jgi:site-specific DNA recombinase